jgi:serine/threonine protein kinase
MADEPTINQPHEPRSPSTTAVDAGPSASSEAAARTVHEATLVKTSYTVVVGQRFGEYELLTEIARGGMGVVYRARHTTLDRVVALKMILAGRLANAEDVWRFRSEAEAAAKLQHPNIVAVHDVGDCDGQHYFTMEYIAGTSLDKRLAQGPLACMTAARYVRILARAIAYAHRQGILHRDLKPSNVLIDVEDEPHITDFGLAKRLGPATSGQTRSGAILGTPSYMSPEQAQGKTNELGPSSDVYSLGAILYELITGRPPFRAETPLDTVMQVIDHQPVPPRLLNPMIDHDLETICLKCLEKDPQGRYASAEELGEDLQRYLNGDSINARSFNMIDRLTRVLERDTRTADFSTWSSMVLAMAAIVGVEHVGVFLLVWTAQPTFLITAARVLQFALLGYLFWYNRRSQLLPTSASERELWTIWIGYFTTYFFIVIVTRSLAYFEILQPRVEWHAHAYFLELLPYPFISLVAGLAFFIMGSNYWGRCYAIGSAFFVLAALMTLELTLAPLLFGLLWTFVLGMLGLHLRNQGRLVENRRTPATVPSSQAPTVQYREQK